MTRITTMGLVLLVLGVAGAAQAQSIDCSGGCTDTKYGLGPPEEDLFFREDQVPFQFHSSQFTGSIQVGYSSPEVTLLPACANQRSIFPLYGQVILREQDSCVMDSVADGSGCLVEIPTDTAPARSGVIRNTTISADILGLLLEVRVAGFVKFEGSVGERVLIGGGPATKIVWDDSGLPEELGGLIFGPDEGLACCQSSTGDFCPQVTLAEYPLLSAPQSNTPYRRGTPHWIFDGGAETNWRVDPNHQVPGQEQGLCLDDPNIACCVGAVPPPDLPCDNPCPGLGDVCDLRARGLSSIESDVLEDGGHNFERCSRAPYALRGFVNQNCWLRQEYPEPPIDPLPGCLLGGFGIHPRPDLDCNGVDDTVPDLCPSHSERDPLLDTNGDGVGDECQCGDTNTMFDQNGELEFVDALRIVQTVQGTGSADFRLADTDGNKLLSFGDAFNVVQGVQAIQDPTTFTCGRNP